jgi:hypothetical protein
MAEAPDGDVDPQIAEEPQIAVEPQMALLPQIAEAPSSQTELPQIALEPQMAEDPQIADEPQMALVLLTTRTVPLSFTALGEAAFPPLGTRSVLLRADQMSRYPAPIVNISY